MRVLKPCPKNDHKLLLFFVIWNLWERSVSPKFLGLNLGTQMNNLGPHAYFY
jgi:hypothetical protein